MFLVKGRVGFAVLGYGAGMVSGFISTPWTWALSLVTLAVGYVAASLDIRDRDQQRMVF